MAHPARRFAGMGRADPRDPQVPTGIGPRKSLRVGTGRETIAPIERVQNYQFHKRGGGTIVDFLRSHSILVIFCVFIVVGGFIGFRFAQQIKEWLNKNIYGKGR
jgi:hypothetical protein